MKSPFSAAAPAALFLSTLSTTVASPVSTSCPCLNSPGLQALVASQARLTGHQNLPPQNCDVLCKSIPPTRQPPAPPTHLALPLYLDVSSREEPPSKPDTLASSPPRRLHKRAADVELGEPRDSEGTVPLHANPASLSMSTPERPATEARDGSSVTAMTIVSVDTPPTITIEPRPTLIATDLPLTLDELRQYGLVDEEPPPIFDPPSPRPAPLFDFTTPPKSIAATLAAIFTAPFAVLSPHWSRHRSALPPDAAILTSSTVFVSEDNGVLRTPPMPNARAEVLAAYDGGSRRVHPVNTPYPPERSTLSAHAHHICPIRLLRAFMALVLLVAAVYAFVLAAEAVWRRVARWYRSSNAVAAAATAAAAAATTARSRARTLSFGGRLSPNEKRETSPRPRGWEARMPKSKRESGVGAWA